MCVYIHRSERPGGGGLWGVSTLFHITCYGLIVRDVFLLSVKFILARVCVCAIERARESKRERDGLIVRDVFFLSVKFILVDK